MAALTTHVTATDDELILMLSDGGTLDAPIIWFPHLVAAAGKECL